ncbi:MAG TPA: ribonuclease III [Proteobacteria bacterium]|nr:ribonuclease III [Pseudomonadota bacterium]
MAGDSDHDQITGLESILGYVFQRPELLLQALTHRSYLNETRGEGCIHELDYERLEFLGDAVLELKVSEILYRRFQGESEGGLSRTRARIVNAKALAQFADELCLGDFLRLGRGEERQGGRCRPSLLADVFEALLAALYLDGGNAVLESLVQRLVDLSLTETEVDSKTALQEIMQEKSGRLPVYAIISREGADHCPWFQVAVKDGRGLVLGRGQGESRKNAEQQAAGEALKRLAKDLKKD